MQQKHFVFPIVCLKQNCTIWGFPWQKTLNIFLLCFDIQENLCDQGHVVIHHKQNLLAKERNLSPTLTCSRKCWQYPELRASKLTRQSAARGFFQQYKSLNSPRIDSPPFHFGTPIPPNFGCLVVIIFSTLK